MLKWLHNILYPDSPAMPQTTHYFTGTSKDCNYKIEPTPTGERAILFGWRRALKTGDFVILPHGATTTRYQILGINYYDDTPPMFKAYVKFAPREYAR